MIVSIIVDEAAALLDAGGAGIDIAERQPSLSWPRVEALVEGERAVDAERAELVVDNVAALAREVAAAADDPVVSAADDGRELVARREALDTGHASYSDPSGSVLTP